MYDETGNQEKRDVGNRDGGESGSDSETRGSRAFFGDSIGSRLEA